MISQAVDIENASKSRSIGNFTTVACSYLVGVYTVVGSRATGTVALFKRRTALLG